MATETGLSAPDVSVPFGGNWRLGLVSGFFGGIAFGVVASVVDPLLLRETIPAIYGVDQPGDVILGWVVHVMHAAVLGIAFAALVGLTGCAGGTAREQVGEALLFSLAVWLVLAAIALPLWLSVVSTRSLPVPYISNTMLAGHLAYGMVMGTIYYAFDAPPEPPGHSEH